MFSVQISETEPSHGNVLTLSVLLYVVVGTQFLPPAAHVCALKA